MTNLNIKIEKQGYLTEETKKVLTLLNSDEEFKTSLLEVFKLIYHNREEDNSTPEFNTLIETKLKEIEPDENKREHIYLNNALMNTYNDWRSENILPLFIEELQDAYIKDAYFLNLNKCHKFIEYYMQLSNGEYYTKEIKVNKVITLYDYDFQKFVDSLLNGRDFLTEGGTDSRHTVKPNHLDKDGYLNAEFWNDAQEVEKWKAQSYNVTQIIQDTKGNCIVVDTQGYNYARYVAFLGKFNAFNPHNLTTPETTEFLKVRREAQEQRRLENEQAYYNAYCN